MTNYNKNKWTASTPEGRWGLLGPYYAMFPISFVRQSLERFCRPRGGVIDPFCGRGTVPFVAKVSGRPAFGVDINPVAWVFGATKIDPEPNFKKVVARLEEIATAATLSDQEPENEFQKWAWSPKVLAFLQAARRGLDWKSNRIDRTLVAILLVYLHGKTGAALSNQMRQSKSMSPEYSVKWWKQKGMLPPDIKFVDFLRERILWRYKKGIIRSNAKVDIVLGDAKNALSELTRTKYEMLLTSPPYCGVTNYRYDNWIRLWVLGDVPLPDWKTAQRYSNKEHYTNMLLDVFSSARDKLSINATVLVRTDSREFTKKTTQEVLKNLWPDHYMYVRSDVPKKSQTSLFGDFSSKPGETDYLLMSKQMKISYEFDIC